MYNNDKSMLVCSVLNSNLFYCAVRIRKKGPKQHQKISAAVDTELKFRIKTEKEAESTV